MPVFTSNEDYRMGGGAAPEEKAELNRVYRKALEAKLSTGTVHVYVLTPDGKPIDSLHVANAAKADRLMAMLEGSIEKLKPVRGEPVVKPTTRSAPPPCEEDSLVLHLTARSIKPGGAWGEFPVENWIVLSPAHWRRLLPPAGPAAGVSWELPKEVCSGILTHFYPATENNDVAKNVIEEQSLKATVIAADGVQVRARIEGWLKMRHDFYHKDDGNRVEATILGYMDLNPKGTHIRTLRLTTEQASYGRGTFGIALFSVP